MKIVVFALIAMVLVGCPTPPVPPDARVDAGTDTSSGDCFLHCAQLEAVGCPEGKAPNCVAVCEHVQATRLTDLHLPCVAKARTAAAVRACGVACEGAP